jgi:hypothetical protein
MGLHRICYIPYLQGYLYRAKTRLRLSITPKSRGVDHSSPDGGVSFFVCLTVMAAEINRAFS